jgi:hypothetical protein
MMEALRLRRKEAHENNRYSLINTSSTGVLFSDDENLASANSAPNEDPVTMLAGIRV